VRTCVALASVFVALAAPSAAQASPEDARDLHPHGRCLEWAFPGGDLKVYQSNGYILYFYNFRVVRPYDGDSSDRPTLVAGRVRHNRLNPGISGSFNGEMQPNHIYLTVYWPGNSVGQYYGTINGFGRAEGGTHDRANPRIRATWYSDEVLNCVRPR
jgi:hypothetical protein